MRLIVLLALAIGVSCTLAYPHGPADSFGNNTEVDNTSIDWHDVNLEMSATPSGFGDDDANVHSNIRPKRTLPIVVVGNPYGYGYGNYGYGYGRRPYYGRYPGYWRRPYYGYY